MTPHPDTLRAMDAPRSEPASARYDELHAEAAEALAFAANTLRGIRDRYRAMYMDELARWDALHDELLVFERQSGDGSSLRALNGTSPHAADDGAGGNDGAASAAEAGAADHRLRMLRGDTEQGRIEAHAALW